MNFCGMNFEIEEYLDVLYLSYDFSYERINSMKNSIIFKQQKEKKSYDIFVDFFKIAIFIF